MHKAAAYPVKLGVALVHPVEHPFVQLNKTQHNNYILWSLVISVRNDTLRRVLFKTRSLFHTAQLTNVQLNHDIYIMLYDI